MMTVRVLLFGPERDAVGASSVEVQVRGSATTGEVMAALAEQFPSLAATVKGARLAVRGEFSRLETVILEGDECALIGLVSGG